MNDNSRFKTMFKSFILFVTLIVLTFYILFKDGNITAILDTIKNANMNYILLAVMCMCVFLSLEGINIIRNVNLLGYNLGFLRGIKYALVGFFFSAITPSSSGGQPMQLYYMNKDKIDLSHGAIALFIELASYQFNAVLIAVTSFIINFSFFTTKVGNIKYLLFIGISLNALVFFFIFFAIFSKKLMPKAVNLITLILTKLKYKKVESFKEKADKEIAEYKQAADLIKKEKLSLLKTILITFFQLNFMHAVSFFVYKSFGLNTYNIIEIITIQSVLYSSVAALPLPGGIGASEGGFLTLFKFFYPIGLVSSGMLLTRGINFYLFVLISGTAVTLYTLDYIRKNSNAVKV